MVIGPDPAGQLAPLRRGHLRRPLVSDAMPQDQWNQRVNELLESLPPDELISVIDAHI